MAKAKATDVTNVPATVDQSTGEIVSAGTMPKLVIKRRVTTPLFKMRVGLPVAFIFLTAITEGKKIEKSKYDGVPHLAHVFNVQDNTVYQFIVNTVVHKEIEAAYPDQSYVGKGFLIELHNAEGKSYKICDLQEFEIPEGLVLPKV